MTSTTSTTSDTDRPINPDWYNSSLVGNVDLNDQKTYEEGWFAAYSMMDASELREMVHQSIGKSLYYMMCWHPGWDRHQFDRVLAFGKFFAREVREPDRFTNVRWLRKQLYLILDETENQC